MYLFLPFWYICSKKNLATLLFRSRRNRPQIVAAKFARSSLVQKQLEPKIAAPSQRLFFSKWRNRADEARLPDGLFSNQKSKFG
jgi:hypothetical protein